MSATADRKARDPGPTVGHGSVDRNGIAWRGLDELAGDPEVRRFAEAEFPNLADRLGAPVDRRTLMKVMGASLALGGLAACDEAEHIVPYVRQPEHVVPGRPRFYATALASEGYGIGALVESHEGRPNKVEGNPDHPASRGATDAVMQAAVLGLFDRDRSRGPVKSGEEAGFDRFLGDMADLVARLREEGGVGTALLVEPTASPTYAAGLAALRELYPEIAVYSHDPLATAAVETATGILYGRPLLPHYRFDRATMILSLDADFLGEGPGRLAYAADYAQQRRVRRPEDDMSRHYALQTTPTITGAAADHHRSLRPDEVDRVAAAILRSVNNGESVPEGTAVDPVWLRVLIDDLRQAGRGALVVPGPHHSPFVQAAAIAANSALGAIGHTMDLIEPPLAMAVEGDLAALCGEIAAGRIARVIVLGADPVATATADLDVADLFSRLELLVHLGLYRNRTAALAHWHVPAAHELESWGDLRAYDGTASIVQPLIRPLYGGLTPHEILAVLAGEFGPSPLEIVRSLWLERVDERTWLESLRAGVVPDTAAAPVAAQPSTDFGGLEPQQPSTEGLTLRFVADPFVRDGRHANSSWLQELPRPLTKMVWGNAALVSSRTAATRGLENGDVVTVARAGRSLDAAVWIMPAAPDETVVLSLGYGQTLGSVAALAGGYDAYRLRMADALWHGGGAQLTAAGKRARVLTTQHHQTMEGRHLVRHATLREFRADPHFVHKPVPPPPDESVYPEWEYPREKWAMSVDTAACIGCMACVAACQAENNIATVGPEECALGHEMHWLRIDRYYEGPPENPDTYLQPVPCMHCEKAPCEPVCPVNATVHTHDGLNAQIYNRCIGTRYCSQNCPYKVRRFNFFDTQVFDREAAGPKKAVYNPDVSVRQRGVMEKCTYCVQRISAARIEARKEGHPIRDGAVVTACQQACPTQAIVFGDLNDPQAKVSALKAAPHDYALLAELNTRPRTTYLADISNPNPRLQRHTPPDEPQEDTDG